MPMQADFVPDPAMAAKMRVARDFTDLLLGVLPRGQRPWCDDASDWFEGVILLVVSSDVYEGRRTLGTALSLLRDGARTAWERLDRSGLVDAAETAFTVVCDQMLAVEGDGGKTAVIGRRIRNFIATHPEYWRWIRATTIQAARFLEDSPCMEQLMSMPLDACALRLVRNARRRWIEQQFRGPPTHSC